MIIIGDSTFAFLALGLFSIVFKSSSLFLEVFCTVCSGFLPSWILDLWHWNLWADFFYEVSNFLFSFTSINKNFWECWRREGNVKNSKSMLVEKRSCKYWRKTRKRTWWSTVIQNYWPSASKRVFSIPRTIYSLKHFVSGKNNFQNKISFLKQMFQGSWRN